MRRIIKVLIFMLLFAPLLWFGISWTMYRLPSNEEAHIFEGEIHYKFVEINLTNRGLFKSICLNKAARFEGNLIFYISTSDHEKLWSVNPHKMNKNGYTYKVMLKTQPLLFGGFGLANVVRTNRIEKEPIISK